MPRRVIILEGVPAGHHVPIVIKHIRGVGDQGIRRDEGANRGVVVITVGR